MGPRLPINAPVVVFHNSGTTCAHRPKKRESSFLKKNAQFEFVTRFENANGARSSPLLPSAVADACSLQAQLSDGNVSLKHTETRSKKAFSISSNGRAWANGSGARGAKNEADARFSLTWGAYIPPIWILRLGGTPPLPEMLGWSAIPARWRRE